MTVRARFLVLSVMVPGLLAADPAAGQAESPPAEAIHRIHVIVALCDNDSQGIVPVSDRIGNGDDLVNNLYWGCSDGMKLFFKTSPHWELVESSKAEGQDADTAKILETCVFRHKETGALLTAEAWRGREIRAATEAFLTLLRESSAQAPELVAFIGHNGLMDFQLPKTPPAAEGNMVPATPKAAVVLCCRSRAYFASRLENAGAKPLLLTEQLMYPGSFLLEAALDGWFRNESLTEIRDRAARAYAKNQGIGVSAARGVFTELE